MSQLGSVSKRKTHVTMKAGNRLEICQLGLGDMGYLREQAAQHYRTETVAAFKDTNPLLEMLDPEERLALIKAEVERIRFMTPDELPMKKAKLLPRRKADGSYKMKGGELVLREQDVEYFVWWMDATVEGKLHQVYRSLQKGSTPMTLDEVDNFFMEELIDGTRKEDLDDIANRIDELSDSPLGNSSPPEDGGPTADSKRKRKRRRRRRQNRGTTGPTESV